MNAIESFAARFATPWVHWIALLGLCAAYLQGGIVKATDFSGAIAEMEHFGLAPAAPLAIAVIASGVGRLGYDPRRASIGGLAPLLSQDSR